MRKKPQRQNQALWKAPCYAPPTTKRRRGLSDLLFWGFLLCAVIAVGMVIARYLEYRQAREEYARYQAMVWETLPPTAPLTAPPTVTPSPAPSAFPASIASPSPKPSVQPQASQAPATAAPEESPPFFSAHVYYLQKENPDAVAWLDILDTDIQYPVVQGEDNEYYVTHTFARTENDSGAIFMDSYNHSDFSDFNTVLYGHNMKDGSMFSDLRHYERQSYADEHRFIELTLQNRKLRYRVFAAYVSQSEEDADFRGFSCFTAYERRPFLQNIRRRSLFFSSAEVDPEDRILTLATCTGGTHPWYFVVHAVLVEEQTTAT